jgi:hypothetical protein
MTLDDDQRRKFDVFVGDNCVLDIEDEDVTWDEVPC